MAVYQKLLRPDGIFVGVGNSKQASLALIKGFFSKQFTAVAGAFKPAEGYLDYAKSLAERGQLTPLIDKVYSVYQVEEAICYLLTRHAKGKVVVKADF